MAQILRQSTAQGQKHSQSLKSIVSQDSYQRQLQEASCERRQAAVLLEVARLDGLDDSEPEMPGDDDGGEFDSEMPCGDDDAVRAEPQDFESLPVAGDYPEEGGFMPDVDAIYVMPCARGRYRCLVEEDLSKWAFNRSHGNARVNTSGKLSKEPSRMTCCRKLAEWLETDFQEALRTPNDLIQTIQKEGVVSQKDFCKSHQFMDDLGHQRSLLSKTLKSTYLVWADYALSLRALFQE